MHSMRMHGDGIAECPTCGAVYRLIPERGDRDDRKAFDCLTCGDRLDTRSGRVRQSYELVVPPQVGGALNL